MIVPTLCVGMPHWTRSNRFGSDAERHWLHSHAERRERSLRADDPAIRKHLQVIVVRLLESEQPVV